MREAKTEQHRRREREREVERVGRKAQIDNVVVYTQAKCNP